jgi:hypothetical protein
VSSRATAVLALIGLFWLSDAAIACTTLQPESDDVRFSRFVAQASEITLVRVVDTRKLPKSTPMDNGLREYFNPFEFTLQTIERIKGAAPSTFKLTGDGVDVPGRGADWHWWSDHEDVGLFWSWFHGGCYYAPAFVDGGEYLLFRDSHGQALDFYGRNPERISTRDDAWLTAVKALVRDPSLKYGRKAKLIDFLAAARAVVVTKTLTCDREYLPPYSPSSQSGWPVPGEQQIVMQLWGAPVSLKELHQTYAWGVFETCDKGQERLIILHRHWPMRLRVSANQTVDFSGFLDGTGQGMIEDKILQGSRWFAQTELEGPRVWKLSDMKSALAAVSRRKLESH